MSVTLHTSLGDIKIELFCELVPRASKNFLGLCASGYYNGVKFHRNIQDFIIQGGAPKDSKKSKGGKSIYGEYFEDEIVDSLKFDSRGVLGMANKGPNTNNSQFFISYKELPHLNNTSTIFGKIIFGFDTLDAMETTDVDNKHRPIEPIIIKNVTIHANPIAQKELIDKSMK
mmetsp:Transcript_58764/g.71848  ORF Transcript_58764/g.71848 Transcript_58764/m.71848 type:complete len:172 (-) Transcript_58764:22-537(-)